MFKSTIAAGTIRTIDTTAAEKAPGVLAVITHKNAPKLNVRAVFAGVPCCKVPRLSFFGQHIGMVVAETFEQARYASHLINVTYEKKEPKVDFEKLAESGPYCRKIKRKPTPYGVMRKLPWARQRFKVEEVYETPIEHHHPLEPHATIAEWDWR